MAKQNLPPAAAGQVDKELICINRVVETQVVLKIGIVKHDNQRMITENPKDEMALLILLSFPHIEYFSE